MTAYKVPVKQHAFVSHGTSDVVQFGSTVTVVQQADLGYDAKAVSRLLNNTANALKDLDTAPKRKWVHQQPIIEELTRELKTTNIDPRVIEAIKVATFLHRKEIYGQLYPFNYHLIRTAALVAEHGGSLNALIASPLHDVLDDHHRKKVRPGFQVSLQSLNNHFGAAVATIVDHCSYRAFEKSLPKNGNSLNEKQEWLFRQDHLLKAITSYSVDDMMVKMSDGVCGNETSLENVNRIGDKQWVVFEKFGKQGELYKQGKRLRAFKQNMDSMSQKLQPNLIKLLRKLRSSFKNLLQASNETLLSLRTFEQQTLSPIRAEIKQKTTAHH